MKPDRLFLVGHYVRRSWLVALALMVSACGQASPQAAQTPASHHAGPPLIVTRESSQGFPSASAGPSPSPPQVTAGTPLPSRFRIWDLSFISYDISWGLASYSCGRYQCAALFHTTDRWKTWQQVAAPTAYVAQAPDTLTGCMAGAPCIAQVRFANASTGYLFGSDLFVTRDGARTWFQEKSPLRVVALETVGATALRVVFCYPGPMPSPSGCADYYRELVQAEPVTGGSWETLSTPALSGISATMLGNGTQRIYIINSYGSQAGSKTLITSADAGSHWQTLSVPCGDDPVTGIAAAAADHLYFECMDQAKPVLQQAYLVTSEDAGLTFGPRQAAPYATASLVAGSARVMAAVDILHGVVTSVDGGSSWQLAYQAQPSASWSSVPQALGFEDGFTAHFVYPGTTVWTLSFPK